MYDFNNAVRLNRIGGEYVITVDGKPLETSLSSNQRRNPLIAVSRYASAIDEYLRGNVKKYLVSNGHPAIHVISNRRYRITYVLSGWGLKNGYVAFGIEEVKRYD